MSTRTRADAAEYAEWLLAMVLRCRDLGVESPFVSVANEPSFNRNPMTGEFIRDVILVLGPRLRAAGLRTMVVLPDDVGPSKAAAVSRVVLADPEALRYVGALATHLYDEPLSNLGKMKELSQQYGLPLWMTEFSLSLGQSTGLGQDPFGWAQLVHELIATYDVAAVDYQWGFFGQWAPRSHFITLEHDAHTYSGFKATKEYYFTGQYSRYVTEGARRIEAVSTASDVKVTAFRDGADLVLVFVNSGQSTSVDVRVTGVPGLSRLSAFRTTAGDENWAPGPPILVNQGWFSVAVAPRSVTTFTTRK